MIYALAFALAAYIISLLIAILIVLRTKNERYGYSIWAGGWTVIAISWAIAEGRILGGALIFAIIVISAALTFAYKTVKKVIISGLLVAIPASILVWGIISFISHPKAAIFTLTSYKTAIATFFAYFGGCWVGEGIADLRKERSGAK